MARADPASADAASLVDRRARTSSAIACWPMPSNLTAARDALSAVRPAALSPRDQRRPADRPRTGAVSGRKLRRRRGALRHRAQPAGRRCPIATACCCSTGGRPRSIARRRRCRSIAARALFDAVMRADGRSSCAMTRAARPRTTGSPSPRAARATSSAPGTPPSPAGSARRCGRRRAQALRDDLDRLVTQALIPERARTRARARAGRRAQRASAPNGTLIKKQWTVAAAEPRERADVAECSAC